MARMTIASVVESQREINDQFLSCLQGVAGQLGIITDKLDGMDRRLTLVEQAQKGIFPYSDQEKREAAQRSNAEAQKQAEAAKTAKVTALNKQLRAAEQEAFKANEKVEQLRLEIANLLGVSPKAQKPQPQPVAIDPKKEGAGKWDGTFLEGTFEGAGKKAGTFYQSLKLSQSLSAEEFNKAKAQAEARGYKYSRFAKAFLKEIKEA